MGKIYAMSLPEIQVQAETMKYVGIRAKNLVIKVERRKKVTIMKTLKLRY